MIHKFVLGRCVQCNLPQGDLERVGWECPGHAKIATSTPLAPADGARQPNDTDKSIYDRQDGACQISDAPSGSEIKAASGAATKNNQKAGWKAVLVVTSVITLILVGVYALLEGSSKIPPFTRLKNHNPYVGQTFRSSDNSSTVYFRTSSELEIRVGNDNLISPYTFENSTTIRATVSANGAPKALYYRTEKDGLRGEDPRNANSVLLLSPAKYDEMLALRNEEKRKQHEELLRAHAEMMKRHKAYITWLETFFAKDQRIKGSYEQELSRMEPGPATERIKMILQIASDPTVAESQTSYSVEFEVTASILWLESPKHFTLDKDLSQGGDVRLKGNVSLNGDTFSGDMEWIRVNDQGAEKSIGVTRIEGGRFRASDPGSIGGLTLEPSSEDELEREGREQAAREQEAQRVERFRQLSIEEDMKNEVNRAEDLLRLSCISGGQSLDELKYGFDWKYPKQVHAAIDSALADRLKQLANDPKRLAEFKTTYEKLKSIRLLAVHREEEYQRKRALNPEQYPMKYRNGNYDPICFETWKKSQEHKQSSEQLSGVPKALPVEPAPTGKQTTGLGDEKGKPGTDEIVLFEEHFTKSGNSPDPRMQSNMCFSFKGDMKYRFKRDKGLFPTEKGITLQFRWNAPKPNMPKSWEPGTWEPGAVILQVDVYDVSGCHIMYQPQVKASLDWQDVNVPIIVPSNAESILIWNKWEDVEMYIDDVKIITTAPAPSEIQAADLITAFLKHGEEPNIQTELADYADIVNPYFDQGQQTKAAILKDITEYRTKWPKRSLQLTAIESARLVRMNILEATYRLRYSASKGKQKRSGALIQEIRFTLADQKWLVSGIRTVRQVADVDQHQPEAFTTKEKKAASLVTAFLKHSESPDAQIELADYADIVDPYFYSKRQTKTAILKDITAYRAKWPKISLQLIDIDSVSSDRDDILNVTCRVRYSASNGLRNRSGTLVQRICFTQADKRWLISGVEIVQRMNSDGKVQDAEQSDAQQRQGGPPPQIRLGDVLEFFGRWGER